MSNHTEENNLDPLAQLFIKPLISEVAVNEEEKEEEISAIQALLLSSPDYTTKIKTEDEIRNIQEDQPTGTVSEVSVVPDEVVDQTEEVEDEQALEEFTENLEEKTEREEREKTLKKSYLEKVFGVDLMLSSTRLGEMVLGLPEFAYNVFSWPQNQLVDLGVLDKEWRQGEPGETPAEAFKKDIKIDIPFRRTLLDFYEEETTKLENQQAIWNDDNYDIQGITENFKKGNWKEGFQQMGSGLAESSATSIAMLMSGIGGMTRMQMLQKYTVPFASQEYKQLKEENPDTNDGILIAQALGLGAAETFYEMIGTGTIGRVYKDIILKVGKKEGVKVFKNGLIEMYSTALKKIGAPAGALGEGIEEVATQITQNMIKGKDPFEGVSDAFLLGVGGGATYAGPINIMQVTSGLKEAVNINKINNNLKAINEDYNISDITTIYNPDFNQTIPIQGLNITQISNSQQILDDQITKKIEIGEINRNTADQIKLNYRNTQSAVNQLKPVGLNLNATAVGLLKEKNILQKTIKEVNDAALTQNQTNRVKEIDVELGTLVNEVQAERDATVGMSILPTRKPSIKADELARQYQENPANVDVEALLDQYNKIGLAAIMFDTRKGDMAREDAIAEINKEFAGIMERWSPDKGSFSTFVTANIAPKAQGIYDKYIGQRDITTLDKQEAREVVAEEVDIDVAPTETARAKVYPATLEVITENITPEVRSEQTVKIKDDINRAVATESTSPKVVAQSIVKQTQTPAYRKLIKDKLGKWNSEQYNNNVDRLVTKDFIATIPIAQIKRRFGKLFNIQQTGTTPTTKIEDGKRTDFRKQVYKIPAITDAQLEAVKDYFKANEKRQQSLYSLLGEGIAIEQMQELRGDQQFMTDLQGRLELKGSNLTAEQFINEVEYNLDKRNLEDTSLDVVENTVEDVINNRITEENINDIEADFLSDAISQLETFRKTNLSMNALTGVVEAGLRTLRAARNAGRSLASALKDFTKSIKDFIKKPAAKKPKLTIDELKKIGNVVKSSVRQLANIAGYDLYPAKKKGKALSNGFNAEQKRNRDESVIRNLDNFGTAFFLNTKSWADSGRSIFNKRVKQNINELTDLSKTSLFSGPKYGKIFTEQDFNILKEAEAEQAKYAKMKPEKRKALLKDKKFIELQENKIKVLKKIIDGINTDIRDSNGKIIKERLEFWGTWLNTQGNISTHPMRVLAPIKFFSTNNQLDSNAKNFVAEHTLPSSNATKVVLEMLINNSVNKDFKFLKDNYTQGQLLKTDDDIIALAGYRSQLPSDFFSMDKPNTWVRYLLGNPEINLNEYVTYKDGEIVTIAESLGLGLSKANQNPDNINMQNNLLVKVFKGETTINKAKKELEAANKTNKKSFKQVNNNKEKIFGLIKENGTTEQSIVDMSNADQTAQKARDINTPTKGISVFDFDDTLAYSKSKVIVNMPDGSIKKITPAEFAVESENLQEQGAEFDFSEFNKVIKGKKGPLADLALKRQEKFGSGDIFVLTARPQASAVSIKAFLDGIGLNIPLENITGLEDGSPDAKALWVLDKTAQGYNDFYFADDALPNVQAVKNILDQVDVKSKVQQAKKNKVKNLDKEFNVIIEQQSGKKWYKTYSEARAKTTGRKVGTFEFFIPPSAEDFAGLLYKILPKGEKGNLAKKWFKDNLFDPFNKAEQQVISDKISVANDFQALRKNIDNIPKNLNKPVGVGNFTHSQALRVYIWNMQGMEIPGLSTRDLNRLVDKIENNADLKVFAEKIAFIQKGKSYPKPGDNWVAGNITSDIIQNLNKAGRKEALQNWQQNVDIIFSDKNLNKLEALYGNNFILALKNSLGRMKSGSNRPIGMNPQVNNLLDWLNNSVGAVMFLNMRSATLQLISSVNFLNWSDNNPVAASKAFANQKQYWSDVMTLLNSDYLVQRRNGLKINVAESEIAEAARKGGMKGTIAYLLNKGFVLTRFADSMAIATGGASFYRNRVNALLKQVNIDTGNVYTKAEAEAKAFDDFYQISEESQQSSRTDRISMQQASSIGRLILNFANTPMQYARIMKKSALDLANGRGDWKTNLSKIAYYGFVQNLIFNAMQQAVFALAFGSDDEEERTAEDRAGNIANGMVDSILRGLGYGGAAVATVKDVIIKLTQQGAKKNPKYEDAVSEVFNFSPAIDSKVRKLRSAAKTFSWNRKEIKRRGFNLDNPAYLSIAQIVSATTNIPLDRAARIMMNLKQAVDKDTEIWQRVSLMFGYSGWELGLPYWGLQTTIDKEKDEDEAVKTKYKNEANKLKTKGYKRIPMTKGKPDGKLNVDFIQVARPTGDLEYWLMPKK